MILVFFPSRMVSGQAPAHPVTLKKGFRAIIQVNGLSRRRPAIATITITTLTAASVGSTTQQVPEFGTTTSAHIQTHTNHFIAN